MLGRGGHEWLEPNRHRFSAGLAALETSKNEENYSITAQPMKRRFPNNDC